MKIYTTLALLVSILLVSHLLLLSHLVDGLWGPDTDIELATEARLIEQGGDPSQLLPAPAAGTMPLGECNTARYFFGKTADGSRYIKLKLRAVDLIALERNDGEVMVLRAGSSESVYQPVSDIAETLLLKRELQNCIESPVAAEPQDQQIVLLTH